MTSRTHALEDNLDTFTSHLLLVVGGGAALVLLVGIVAVVLQDRRRAKARAAQARAARKAQPPRTAHSCHVRGCTYDAGTLVHRRDTKERVRVCFGHLDEGFARGWWLA